MKMKVYAPNYYSDFRCLAGDCLYNCCQNWKITFSRTDYNKIRSAHKSAGLQKDIERSFKRTHTVKEAEYAKIQLGAKGECPMLNENGLCRLQVECGYNTLPQVCKVFPRLEHPAPAYVEKSCSTGCEAVLWLLLERPDGLRFAELDEDDHISVFSGRGAQAEKALWEELLQACMEKRPALTYYQEIRQFCIAILQNRFYSLPDRLLLLGMAMRGFDPSASSEDVLLWITREIPPLVGENGSLKQQLAALPTNPITGAANGLRLAAVFRLLAGQYQAPAKAYSAALSNLNMEVGSISAHAQVESMDEVDVDEVTSDESNLRYDVDFSFDGERFAAASRHFDELPFTAHLMENLMVNWMFQTQFPLPFPSASQPVWAQYMTLCAVYNFFRVTAVGYMADKDDPADLIHILTVCSRSLLHSAKQLERLVCELSENGSNTLAHMAYLLKC